MSKDCICKTEMQRAFHFTVLNGAVNIYCVAVLRAEGHKNDSVLKARAICKAYTSACTV